MSKSGPSPPLVAELPTVTITWDGSGGGPVLQLEAQHKANVLGWDEKAQNGTFTGDFTDQSKGKSVTQTLPGADIIFPVRATSGWAGRRRAAGGQWRAHALGRHRRPA